MSIRLAAIVGLLIAAVLAGCSEIAITTPASFQKPPKGPPPGPPKIPRLLFVTPNVAPEATGTAFQIEGVNLLPNTEAVVSFGTLTFNGMTNATGSRILPAAGGSFNAPPGTGVIDVEVFVTGQNPPTLQLTNAFYYLPPGSPALPTVTSMSPNLADEFGGITTIFQGTNVPLAAGYQIVVSWLFSRGTVNVVGVQTAGDTWSCPVPAVPAAENFTSGTLQVSVTVSFSSGGLPIPIIASPPTAQTDGNPFRYSIASNAPEPDPNEFVFASGLVGASGASIGDGFVRTVSLYEEATNELTNQPEAKLAARFTQNASSRLAPAGTHYYPSPLLNGGLSFREANSSYAHFTVPPFNRRYTPAPTQASPQPNAVTKPVTGKLFHVTNAESAGALTGTQDGFFAAYSNGEIEYFEPGLNASVWEEIHMHEQFTQFPMFALAHDTTIPRVYVCRMDGLPFIASGRNTNEINCSGVTGVIQGLSVTLAGQFVYFSTDNGNVYRSPVDSATSGVNPIAQACGWPATGSHTVVSDQMSLSGDGTTICLIAGTGNQRWDSFTAGGTPPSTQDVFVIRNANLGSTNIQAVTNFSATTGGARQIVFWNLGDGPTSTYGSQNTPNGSNDRRIYMAGVNNNALANRAGSDVIVNFTGNLCAFVTRENRAAADPPNSDAVINYLYVARTDTVNEMIRVNSATANNFGISRFSRDMAFVPGFWFPRKIPSSGMDRRLVFSCAGIAGGVQGSEQHLFTLDINLSGVGITAGTLTDRSDATTAPPYNIGVTVQPFNYFGAFPSLNGAVLFVIEQRSGLLQYLDLRDGVTSVLENVKRSHDQSDVVLPNNNVTGDPLENTYLPNGFASDPAGSINLEHWGNQIRSLHGPGLSPFLAEYMFFVAEEGPDVQELYVLQMSGLASPLPTAAINLTNVGTPGAIKLVTPARDGGAVAVIRGPLGYIHGYRISASVNGRLYLINDVPGMLNANASALTQSATHVITTGTSFSRGMDWYHDAGRYTLYFGEGSAVQPSPTRSQAFLRFSRINLDRMNNNAIGTVDQIRPGGNLLPEGAVYIYTAGKRE